MSRRARSARRRTPPGAVRPRCGATARLGPAIGAAAVRDVLDGEMARPGSAALKKRPTCHPCPRGAKDVLQREASGARARRRRADPVMLAGKEIRGRSGGRFRSWGKRRQVANAQSRAIAHPLWSLLVADRFRAALATRPGARAAPARSLRCRLPLPPPARSFVDRRRGLLDGITPRPARPPRASTRSGRPAPRRRRPRRQRPRCPSPRPSGCRAVLVSRVDPVAGRARQRDTRVRACPRAAAADPLDLGSPHAGLAPPRPGPARSRPKRTPRRRPRLRRELGRSSSAAGGPDAVNPRPSPPCGSPSSTSNT